MQHLTQLLITIILSIICFSCKNDTQKQVLPKQASKNDALYGKFYKGDFLYKATTKNKISLLKSENGDVITEIPENSVLKILKFGSFETKKIVNRPDVSGKWIEVVYQKDTEFLKGYVFDAYVNYQFNIDVHSSKDTVIVKNEEEFFDAISSNRVIIVDAKIIDLDKGIAYQKKKLEEAEYEVELGFNYKNIDEKYYSGIYLNYLENLTIKGKNLVHFITHDGERNVVNFNRCSNILIDNINFYHKEVPHCEGDVLSFKNCENIYFQNSFFDGSGLRAIKSVDSKNFNFLNCDFYNNHLSILSLEETEDIKLVRCDIYENEIYVVVDVNSYSKYGVEIEFVDVNSYPKDGVEIELSHCMIKDNSNLGPILKVHHSSSSDSPKFYLKNSVIQNNIFETPLFVLNSDTKVWLTDTKIIENISQKNDYIIDVKSSSKIFFKDVTIKGNTDFYDLINKDQEIVQTNFINDDIFNMASDTTFTKFNRVWFDNKEYMLKNGKQRFDYNENTKEFSLKGRLFQGKYCIDYTETDKKYKIYGNIINGKLEGEAVISPKYDRMYEIVNYENGILNGVTKTIIQESGLKVVISKGNYTNGMKEGVFEHFFSDGNISKSITYQKDEISFPQLYYFPNNQLRNKVTENESIHYNPDGDMVAKISFSNRKINMEASKFYDRFGTLQTQVKIPSKHQTNNKEGDVEPFSFSVKNCVLRDPLGTGYIFDKSLNCSTKQGDFTEAFLDKGDNFKWYVFDQSNNLKYKLIYISKDQVVLYKYKNGILYSESEHKMFENEYVLDGVLKYYNINGSVSSEDKFQNGKKL